MKALLSIAGYESRMQLRRPALWLALVAVAALALWELFPSGHNLRRLSELNQASYAARRLFDVGMPLLALAASLLAADRLQLDRRSGMDDLLWTAPATTPARYALGKFTGSFAASSLLPLGLGLAGFLERWLFLPVSADPVPFLKALALLGLLPLAFAVAAALLLGALLGLRLAAAAMLAYLLWSTQFPDADPRGVTQLYRFQGNPPGLVHVPHAWPYGDALVAAGWESLAFQLGCTLATLALLALASRAHRLGGGR